MVDPTREEARMAKGRKVPVTLRAVIQRINRKLAQEGRAGQAFRKYRGGRSLADLGDYYVVDLDRNTVEAAHLDPEAFGRELGVLENWEEVQE
jgi:hypothetical protein